MKIIRTFLHIHFPLQNLEHLLFWHKVQDALEQLSIPIGHQIVDNIQSESKN